MSRYGRASSLIPVESFAPGGLWGASEPVADTTPALHRRVPEEPEPQVPSGFHPRIDAPPKRRRRPSVKPRVTNRPAAKVVPAPVEVRQAVDAVAVAVALRAAVEPVIVARAERVVADVVLELFGEDR